MAVQPYEQVLGDVEALAAAGIRIWMDPAQATTSSVAATLACAHRRTGTVAAARQRLSDRQHPGAAGELGHISGRPGRCLQPRPEAEGR